MDCLLKNQSPPAKCAISISVVPQGNRYLVQETCQTCGAGCAYWKDSSPSPTPAIESTEEPVNG